MPLDASIDERNKALYEKLKAAGADISFEIDDTSQTWYMQEKISFKIASPDDTPNPAGMAHELLHIQLSLKGFSSHFDIYKYFQNHPIITQELIVDLNNNLAHFKMIDDFLEMGFKVDDFLQDTPKTYFLEGMLLQTVKLVALHNAGISDKLTETREIIMLCGNAKLFELYKIKDPNTKNGLHPDGVMGELKEINTELINNLDDLFTDWNKQNTVDNLQFYYRLDHLLHRLKIITVDI